MRMKRSKQEQMKHQQSAEKKGQELFSMHQQLANIYEKAGELWAKVDGRGVASQNCFRNAAIQLDSAASILNKAVDQKTLAIGMHQSEIEKITESDDE